MPYIAAKCPNCGGELQLNTDMEHGQCTHCSAYVYFERASQKVQIVNLINIKGSAELQNLITLIKMDLESGRNQTLEFKDRLNRALNQDANNQFLYNLYISQIWEAKIENSTLIEYTGSSKKFVVPYCVTSIGQSSFKQCKILREVTMHENINFIANDIFYTDILITIRAYSNTLPAQYTMKRHTFLHLIDAPKETQEVYISIQKSLRELMLKKNDVYLQIDIFLTKKYDRIMKSSNIFWQMCVIAIILLTVFSIINLKNPILFIVLAMFFGAILIFFSAIYVPSIKKDRESLHLQNTYDTLCNQLLYPSGVSDYKYRRKIINREIIELENDARKIKTAKNKLLNLEVKKFIKENQMKAKIIH